MLDGGLGTELIRAGFDIKDHPLWSARVLVDHPEAIKNIHKSFLLSGADVLITATYQASIEHLVQHCRLDESKALDAIQKAVKLAHEACNEIGRNWKQCFVAGSIGAYGACQCDGSEYNGKYVDNMSLKDLVDWHRPRMKALLDAGVDILAVETIPAQKEAEALVELLKEFPAAKAWLSLSCKDDRHTCHGELFSDVVQTISSSEQIVAVGVNCTSPLFVKSLLQSIKGKVDLPFVVYPECGGEWKDGDYIRNEAIHLSSYVSDWIEAGARWIGGCCGTQPEDIEKIWNVVDRREK